MLLAGSQHGQTRDESYEAAKNTITQLREQLLRIKAEVQRLCQQLDEQVIPRTHHSCC